MLILFYFTAVIYSPILMVLNTVCEIDFFLNNKADFMMEKTYK